MTILGNSLFSILYHVAYFVVNYYHTNCEFFGMDEDELREIEFIISLFVMLVINTMLSIVGYDKWINALSMWFFWFIVISYRGKDLRINTLSFPIIIFFSDYYEIPVWINRLFYPTNPYGMDYVAIALKLLMIVWVCVELRKNNYNVGRIMFEFLVFTVVYIPTAFFIIDISHSRVALITLKLLCLSFVLYELFINKGVKNELS